MKLTIFSRSWQRGQTSGPTRQTCFKPSLFTVTTEPPGGVLQHDPELDPGK